MLDLAHTIEITVNWDSLESIELAEEAKAKLENDGWQQINSFGSVFKSVLVYAREE